MPADLAETRSPAGLLMSGNIEMVVLDLDGSILKMEGPVEGCALTPFTGNPRLKSILAI